MVRLRNRGKVRLGRVITRIIIVMLMGKKRVASKRKNVNKTDLYKHAFEPFQSSHLFPQVILIHVYLL